MKAATDWTSIESVSRLVAEQEATLGSTSPQLADTLTQLADLYFVAEDLINAEGIYWKVLTIRQKALGEFHLATADTLQDLAQLYELQDRYAEAERFYKWATSVRKSSMLKKHSDTLDRTISINLENKLPTISDLQNAACNKCGRRMLDSIVCMYCTQGEFNAQQFMEKLETSAARDNSGPVNKLTSMDGKETHKLDHPNITVGRHPSNDIVFPEDKHVSRHHATIKYASGDFVIIDNDSANGTYLNGEKVKGPVKLKRYDVLTIGTKNLVAGFDN
jgi:tetratricopeptide (TPR) repeat protein